MKVKRSMLVSFLLLGLGSGSISAQAWETEGLLPGDWLIRLRGIVVAPHDSSGEVDVPALGGYVAGSGVVVDTDTVPELDITYMFTPNWGMELILGTSQHDVDATGSALLGALGGTSEVIDAWVLPPTLTLQYHFLPNAMIRPYIGAGINYSLFYSEDVLGPLNQPGATVNIRPSVGLAAQIGLDFDIGGGWFGNVDVKYISMSTDAEFRNTTVGDVNVNVDIDPYVFGVGIGRRF